MFVNFGANVVDTGPAEEPNELSFKKGEVLQILDRAGKWWEARKEDGSEGSKSCFLKFRCGEFIVISI